MPVRPPRSIGCATDVMMAEFDGTVADRGDYWVLRTPSNPGYFWGNCLFFPDPPTEENARPDGPRSWERLFDSEFGVAPPDASPPPPSAARLGTWRGRHFAWDRTAGEAGASGAFLARGYEDQESFALIANRLTPPPSLRPDIEVRPVDGDREWQEAEALCAESFAEHAHGDSSGQREFVVLQFRRYRRMAEAGWGTYFGARLGGELVGAAGIFGREGLFRYQLVATRRDRRKQGVCATLVYGAGVHALSHFGARTLAILAAVDYHAWRVYQSVGLEPAERIPGIRLRPNSASVSA